MISYLDEQVGELIAKLKEIGKYENTLVIFTSDNGPTHVKQVDIEFFNSAGIFVNSKKTVKGSVNEGGLRVPTIATWPSKIKAGSKSDHPSIFYDFLLLWQILWVVLYLIQQMGLVIYQHWLGKNK